MKPLIITYTGKYVDPLDMLPEDIDIRDIAHALACCNRFAGHTQKPINVAQHSVYVSRLCDREHALQGLLHDASESYLGDVTKWLKATPEFLRFCKAEDRLQRQIYMRFGCAAEMDEQVAAADKLMLRFEGEMGFGYPVWSDWSEKIIKYPLITQEENTRIGPWVHWTWRESERLFLDTARALGLDAPPPGRGRGQGSRLLSRGGLGPVRRTAAPRAGK